MTIPTTTSALAGQDVYILVGDILFHGIIDEPDARAEVRPFMRARSRPRDNSRREA